MVFDGARDAFLLAVVAQVAVIVLGPKMDFSEREVTNFP